MSPVCQIMLQSDRANASATRACVSVTSPVSPTKQKIKSSLFDVFCFDSESSALIGFNTKREINRAAVFIIFYFIEINLEFGSSFLWCSMLTSKSGLGNNDPAFSGHSNIQTELASSKYSLIPISSSS
jgi:hypothetical protein